MAIDTLYVSTKTYDWSGQGDKKIFLNSKNFLKIIKDIDIYDCYTTIEDVGCSNLSEVINNSKNIILVNINEETILELDESSISSYLHFIKIARNKISSNLNFLDKIFSRINEVYDKRITYDPVLWSVGCSFTAGAGVGPTQRYGYLLSKMLNINEIMLAEGGASIFWAADQILRSDIRKGDIVVWGLTNPSRVNYNHRFDLTSITINEYINLNKKKQFWTIDYFSSLSLNISNFKQILQVMNFCNKVGVKLYIVNLLDHGLISLLLMRFKNFIDIAGSYSYNSKNGSINYIDLGPDNAHPGPKQHKFYAEEIYKFIKHDENNRP